MLSKWPQDVHSFILDAEVVYVDQEGNFLDFSEIERREKDSQGAPDGSKIA